MKFITPKELLAQVKINEIVEPIVKQICKKLLTALPDRFSSERLSNKGSRAIHVSTNVNYDVKEVLPVKDIVTRRVHKICVENKWEVVSIDIVANRSEQSHSTTDIEFAAVFTPVSDAFKEKE